jgi:hypothetical protein
MLFKKLGDGIISFLKEFTEKKSRFLIKCPDSSNIHNFLKLFPNHKLIILIRDGRDTVESFMRTWPKSSFKVISKTWANHARLILNFIKDNNEKSTKSFLVVKYEDLIYDLRNIFEDLSKFLDINPKSIKIDQLENINLIGSSTNRGIKKDVNWDEIKKPPHFNPIGRWKSWSPRNKKIFKKVAGKELIELGYESENSW